VSLSLFADSWYFIEFSDGATRYFLPPDWHDSIDRYTHGEETTSDHQNNCLWYFGVFDALMTKKDKGWRNGDSVPVPEKKRLTPPIHDQNGNQECISGGGSRRVA
jgi:hypothetical protein